MVRMKRCSIWHLVALYGPCSGRTEWHHVWTYAGKQINEVWAIVGACHRHHEMVKEDPAVRMAFESCSLALAAPEDLLAYPKKHWSQIKATLGIQP